MSHSTKKNNCIQTSIIRQIIKLRDGVKRADMSSRTEPDKTLLFLSGGKHLLDYKINLVKYISEQEVL